MIWVENIKSRRQRAIFTRRIFFWNTWNIKPGKLLFRLMCSFMSRAGGRPSIIIKQLTVRPSISINLTAAVWAEVCSASKILLTVTNNNEITLLYDLETSSIRVDRVLREIYCTNGPTVVYADITLERNALLTAERVLTNVKKKTFNTSRAKFFFFI